MKTYIFETKFDYNYGLKTIGDLESAICDMGRGVRGNKQFINKLVSYSRIKTILDYEKSNGLEVYQAFNKMKIEDFEKEVFRAFNYYSEWRGGPTPATLTVEEQ